MRKKLQKFSLVLDEEAISNLMSFSSSSSGLLNEAIENRLDLSGIVEVLDRTEVGEEILGGLKSRGGFGTTG